MDDAAQAALVAAAPAVLALLVLAGVAALLLVMSRRLADARRRGADAEAQVARLEAELERLRRQRHELLANVSHDLRTPLTAMQGHLELLLLRQAEADPAERRALLATAVRQAERLARLVADLFDLTRLEAGELTAQHEDFSAAELVQDIVHQYADDARRRGVALHGDGLGAGAAAAALRVRADMALVARVLDNLVDNALRHTPEGGRVTLRVRGDGARVAVVVADDGVGIAADTLSQLFERYERAPRVGAAQADGHAGLGLAIARRIVRLHGSDLAISSRPGAGTEVAFDLPRAAPARLAA